MASTLSTLSIFGGDMPWSPVDWTASDDRVRGGISMSQLIISPSSPAAVFQGNLDITTLGGAGFASQRTTGEDRNWDLSGYQGLVLDIARSDEKQYALTMKDTLLPPAPSGAEQSSLTWQYVFNVEEDGGVVYVKWDDFVPTFRGREQNDTAPLDVTSIKRFSFMMRSFFGAQEGDFSLSINSLSAFSGQANVQNEQSSDALQKKAESQPKNGLRKRNEGRRWFG